ncbi:MAG: hypothetical protein EOO03_16505 [Chitinophagaceae bacterium]|nr:MAG: hypothetical protein EOO03_16505 [Chitinophagaceae bacterium]
MVFHAAAVNNVAACIGITAETVPVDNVEKVDIFTKDGTDVGIVTLNRQDRWYIVLSISKTS